MTERTTLGLYALGGAILAALCVVAVRPIRPDADPCLTSGQAVCIVDGVLVGNLSNMPTDPYDRCMFLLGFSPLTGGIELGTYTCESIGENR